MDCPIRSGHELAEAYVAGTLSEAEQDAFEQHYFGCAACLAQVQMLQEVRDGLRRAPAAAPAPRPAAASFTPARWLGLALAASLLAAFGWWWRGGLAPAAGPPAVAVGPADPAVQPPPAAATGTPPATSPTTPQPSAPVEPADRRTMLAQLALVVPPRYVPIAVRGGAAPAPGTFDAAMAHYVAGRHRQAAAALQALSDAAPTDPGIAFFRGISELVLGRTDAARDALTRAISADVQPYADEAHFYLAKAYLAEDAVDLARAELEYAVRHEAGPEGEAQRILAALDRLPR
jgi:tetratricopeptide (TPR) repeat protein